MTPNPSRTKDFLWGSLIKTLTQIQQIWLETLPCYQTPRDADVAGPQTTLFKVHRSYKNPNDPPNPKRTKTTLYSKMSSKIPNKTKP